MTPLPGPLPQGERGCSGPEFHSDSSFDPHPDPLPRRGEGILIPTPPGVVTHNLTFAPASGHPSGGRNRWPSEADGFGLLPHPGPLPLGEGSCHPSP